MKGRHLVGVAGIAAVEGSWHLTPCLPLEFPTVLLLFEYASSPSSRTGNLMSQFLPLSHPEESVLQNEVNIR